MKKVVFLFSLIFIIGVSGCIGQGTTISGGPGIIITDFSVDYSPIYAGESVGLNLELQNQGEFDTDVNRILYFGVEPTAWQLPNEYNVGAGAGHSLAAADPTTGFEGGTYFESEAISAPSSIASSTKFDINVRIEYSYESHFTGTIRIMSRDYLRTLSNEERDRLIQTGGIRESKSTAAPLVMSTASGAHFMATGSSITIPFRITNIGPGLPYNDNSATSDAAVTDGNLYSVDIIDLDDTDRLTCTETATTLSRGKNGGFGCTLTLPTTVRNFEDHTFSLGLRYRYYVDGSTTLTVNPQYGGTGGVTTTTLAFSCSTNGDCCSNVGGGPCDPAENAYCDVPTGDCSCGASAPVGEDCPPATP